MTGVEITLLIASVVILLLVALWRVGSRASANNPQAELQQATKSLNAQADELHAVFFRLAAAQGKPRDLTWIGCDWLEEIAYAREVQSGLLTAFQSVNIRFEAVEGGDMEGVAAVSTVRDATAVFHYADGHWGTGGRALFNMRPTDAIARLAPQYEAIETAVN